MSWCSLKKFIIVDGNSLANRAFYAMPYLSNREKQPSGAVFGFANLIVKLIVDQKPDYFAVCFDHARKTFRNEIFAEYKGTRGETPEDLRKQFPIIKQLCEKMGIKVFEHEGIEADDLIGTLAKSSHVENILVSGDRDLLQLIDDNTHVWLTRKGVTEVEVFDEVALKEKYGVKPAGIIELKALMGDSSDNIPGVAGVGEKTATTLIAQYENLDNLYQNIDKITGKLKDKLVEGKDSAYMSKLLATIKTDCEIDTELEKCRYEFPFNQEVRDFFDDWDFRSLVNRKDIFASGVGNLQAKEIERIELSSIDDVKELAKSVKNAFAYNLANLEFATEASKVFFVKKEYDLFSTNLETKDVIGSLKDVFENENILKITNSSKEDIKTLGNEGIKLCNFFDIEIARYVLYAGLPKLPDPQTNEYFSLKYNLEKQMIADNVYMLYKDVEIPLVSVLADMEKVGFMIDPNELKNLDEKYSAELKILVEKIYDLAGEEFNINSPKQVAVVLFDKLGLSAYNNKKRSTGIEILEEIRDQHEVVDYIIEYRKLAKLVSTYINVYQNICEKFGNVVHTIFNQTLTTTGRLSSSEPNMQNIPTRNEQGKNLRKIFVSKYTDGQIISADYSQIELRLLANMAEEETMIDAFKHGVDVHTKTASEIFGVPIDCVTERQRRDAKAVNFGIIYGISDFGLAQNIKAPVVKAKNYINHYFLRYPKIKTFMEKNVEYAKEHGYIKSYFGRIRHIPEIQSSNKIVEKFGERVAMNMPLQGTASDIIKMAMVKIFEKMQGMQSHLILQIHDELIVDAPANEVEQIKTLLKTCMEGVCQFEVPLEVSVSSGRNLFECK